MTALEEEFCYKVFPFYLEGAKSLLAFRRCNLLPGIVIRQCEMNNIGKFQDYLENMKPHRPLLSPNIVVTLDERMYYHHLLEKAHEPERRADGSKEKKPYSKAKTSYTWLYPMHRHVLTSLFLLKRCFVAYPRDGMTFDIDSSGRISKWRYGRESLIVTHFSRWGMYSTHWNGRAKITAPALRLVFSILEDYYRPTGWLGDRVGVALGALWAFLSDPPPELGFISLVTVLEALLGTGGSNEITHQISERVAIVLGKTGEQRFQLYRKTKEIYAFRSKISHGNINAEPKRKGGSFVNSVYSSVGHLEYSDLVDIVSNVFYNVIRNEKYMALVRGRDADGELNTYFNKLLLGCAPATI